MILGLYYIYIYTYIYTYTHIYIKWTVFLNVTTKSAQHANARMIAIITHVYVYTYIYIPNTFCLILHTYFT